MSIAIRCTCGYAYDFSLESAGQSFTCPDCKAVIDVPDVDPTDAKPEQFKDDLFTLTPKALSPSASYSVFDSSGGTVYYAERPGHHFRNLVATFVAFIAGMFGALVIALLIYHNFDLVGPLGSAIEWSASLGGGALVLFGVIALLYRKREFYFYSDETKHELLIKVSPLRKFEIYTSAFSIRDVSGNILGYIHTNHLTNLVRRSWKWLDPQRKPVCIVTEDRISLALLRRWLGMYAPLLLANFKFVDPGSRRVLGGLTRNYTFDTGSVLDLSADSERTLDRRAAVALAVMADQNGNR